MFHVQFTTEATREFERQAAQGSFAKPGVMIHRQGPKGDVKRSADGTPQWSVERPHPWRAQIGDFSDFGDNPVDVIDVRGIPVWLALVPRPGEYGVEISVREGAFHVEPLAA